MTTIKAKSKTGSIVEMTFEEIIDIDGQPYVRQASEIEFRNLVASLVERVAALEVAIGSQG